MSSLGSFERRTLLEVARRALTLAVAHREILEEVPHSQALDQAAGAFVTLREGQRLRGCIGQLPSRDMLVEVVAHCAASAALEDPRFEPVRAEELAGIEIELSVLSPLEVIELDKDAPQEVASKIAAGKHGLVVTSGGQRGVLLPQVATEHHWDALRLLEETCQKAGLPKDAWKQPGTRVEVFTAQVFAEKERAVA
jgi:AmmeMemoRadiSam system protein A